MVTNLTEEQIKNNLIFLERVDLKGKEAYPLIELVQLFNNTLKQEAAKIEQQAKAGELKEAKKEEPKKADK